jgi:hypothetical protein
MLISQATYIIKLTMDGGNIKDKSPILMQMINIRIPTPMDVLGFRILVIVRLALPGTDLVLPCSVISCCLCGNF